jgi:hypothetical protein
LWALRALKSLRALRSLRTLGSLDSGRTLRPRRACRPRHSLNARRSLNARGALWAGGPGSGRASGWSWRPRHTLATAAAKSSKRLLDVWLRESLDARPDDRVDVLETCSIFWSFRFAKMANPAAPHVFI